MVYLFFYFKVFLKIIVSYVLFIGSFKTKTKEKETTAYSLPNFQVEISRKKPVAIAKRQKSNDG